MISLKFDFHLHSCLSPCGSDDMTPGDLAAMCALAGYDAVALTDHNSTANCPAFCAAAERLGLLGIPGMELTTVEEIHVICLLPDLAAAAEFGMLVGGRLCGGENRPEFFGRQLVMDAEDRLLWEERALLAGATDISVMEAAALAAGFGGVAYPAHIDRPAFSLISNLGLWMPEAGFPLVELSRCCPPAFRQRPDLEGVPFLTGCDAHALDQIPDADQCLPAEARTAQAVLKALKTGEVR